MWMRLLQLVLRLMRKLNGLIDFVRGKVVSAERDHERTELIGQKAKLQDSLEGLKSEIVALEFLIHAEPPGDNLDELRRARASLEMEADAVCNRLVELYGDHS